MKIIFNNKKEAIGAKIKLPTNKIIQVMARKEVILSAGTFGSPQILMLSGIGPEAHLKEKGIEVVYNSPQVGKNFQDQPFIPIIMTTSNGIATLVQTVETVTKFDTLPLATIFSQLSLNKSQNCPDCQVYSFVVPVASPLSTLLCVLLNRLEDVYCSATAQANIQGEILLSYMTLMYPKSKGEILLKSNNINDKPIIHTRYFNNTDDLEKLVNCTIDFLKVLNTPSMEELGADVYDLEISHCKDLEFDTREYWECLTVHTASSHHHPCCTCAMGPADAGVVDTKLKVHGVKRLRVVDMSVARQIIKGYALTVMIAEKTADDIKAEYGML